MNQERRRGKVVRGRASAARRVRPHALERWLLPITRRRKRKAGGGFSSFLRHAFYWSVVVGLWAVVGVCAVVAYYSAGLPDTKALWRSAAGPSIVVLDASGQTLATRGAASGADLTLADMSPYLPLAVLAAEDRRYYTHWGVDLVGVMRAAFTNFEEGRVVQGGSTITQQLAKNVFLTPERTFRRKMQEALLAVWLEWRFSKDEILTLYLNRVYLGAGTYGVEAAARRYFDKPARDLTLPESAMIAGLLKAPSRYAPTNDPAAAEKRTALVLDTMVDAGFVTAEARRGAHETRIKFASGTRSQGAQYFVDWVLDTLPSFIGPPKGELIVETTLHLPFQRVAERAVASVLDKEGSARNAGQAALVAVDSHGAVRAMVGGREYSTGPFNRATDAQRQPGSAFKPFVYLAALENGRSPRWKVLDAPLTLANWHPTNFEPGYRGEVSLEKALALSLNTPAVRLSQNIGRHTVIEAARRLGIASPLGDHPSLALGTEEVNLLELAGAYLPFATGGEAPYVHAIRRVVRRDGTVLYKQPEAGMARVIAPENAGAMNAMLSAAVRYGTGHTAQLKDRACAGKTGTSQDFRDAWFIGYTADLVTGVWVGNDDGKPMKKVTGGTLPAEIWKAFMARAAVSYPARPLPDGGYVPEPETRVAETPTTPTADGVPERTLSFFERLTHILSGGDSKP